MGVSLYAAAFAAGVLLAVGLMRQIFPSKTETEAAATKPQEVRQTSDSVQRLSFVSRVMQETSQDSSQTITLLFDEQSGETHLYFRNVPAAGPGNYYVVVAHSGSNPSKPLARIHIDGDGQGQTVISSMDKAEATSLRLELRANQSAGQDDSI